MGYGVKIDVDGRGATMNCYDMENNEILKRWNLPTIDDHRHWRLYYISYNDDAVSELIK